MEEVTQRIVQLMQQQGLSASQMADRLGVQRSAISHLLSGRNRPSLDFIIKVLDSFPEVSSEWLLRGRSDEKVSKPAKPSASIDETGSASSASHQTQIERVLIFYNDHTVEEYRMR